MSDRPTCRMCGNPLTIPGMCMDSACYARREDAKRGADLLTARLEHVRDELRRDADKGAAMVGECVPVIARMREYVAELSACIGLLRGRVEAAVPPAAATAPEAGGA